MERANRRVGLPLFQMEEGMGLSSFLSKGELGFWSKAWFQVGVSLSPFGETGEGFALKLKPHI